MILDPFLKNVCEGIWWNGTRSRIVGSALVVSRVSHFIRNTGYTRFRQRRAGNQRMPWCEEHRKAVCVNSARTVWWGRAGKRLFSTLPVIFSMQDKFVIHLTYWLILAKLPRCSLPSPPSGRGKRTNSSWAYMLMHLYLCRICCIIPISKIY